MVAISASATCNARPTAGTGPCCCFVVASWLCLNGCDGHSYAVQIQLGLQQAICMRALTKARAPTGSRINSHALFSGSYTHTLRLCLSASVFLWSAPLNLSLRLLPVRRPLSVQALTLALFSALLCAPLDRFDSI
jgi:hypothetical protein